MLYIKTNLLNRKIGRKKINSLTDLKTRLTDELKKELEDYSKSWKKSISRYQAQIISKIEIPFYLYSATNFTIISKLDKFYSAIPKCIQRRSGFYKI